MNLKEELRKSNRYECDRDEIGFVNTTNEFNFHYALVFNEDDSLVTIVFYDVSDPDGRDMASINLDTINNYCLKDIEIIIRILIN